METQAYASAVMNKKGREMDVKLSKEDYNSHLTIVDFDDSRINELQFDRSGKLKWFTMCY